MDKFERLMAAFAEQKRRWAEKYGCYDPPREYPTMEEVMRREVEGQWNREASACSRMLEVKAVRDGESEKTN